MDSQRGSSPINQYCSLQSYTSILPEGLHISVNPRGGVAFSRPQKYPFNCLCQGIERKLWTRGRRERRGCSITPCMNICRCSLFFWMSSISFQESQLLLSRNGVFTYGYRCYRVLRSCVKSLQVRLQVTLVQGVAPCTSMKYMAQSGRKMRWIISW